LENVFPPDLTTHTGDEKQINDPSYEEQSQGEKPNCSRDWFSKVESVGTHEAKYPDNVANGHGMGVSWHVSHQ
jgi:hypothetical protein